MKIGETRPSGTVSGSRRERDAASRYARTAGLSAPAPSDTAAIMGAVGWKSINVLARYLEFAEHNVWA